MNGLQITTAKERSYGSHVNNGLSVLSVTLFIAGVLKILSTGFECIALYWWCYAIGSGLLYGIIEYLYHYFPKWREFLVPILLGILALTLLVRFSTFRNGFSVLGNDLLRFMSGKTGKIYLDFPADGIKGVYMLISAITVFMTLLCRNKTGYYTLSCICICGSIFGLFHVDYGCILLIAGLLLHIFTRNQQFENIQSLSFAFLHYLFLASICALVGILTAIALEYDLSTDNFQKRIETAIHRSNYDSGENAMPEGNLRNLPSLRKSTETALIIQAETPQKFYLRGIAGEIYTGKAWESLSEEANVKGEDLFYWLHKNDFYGQTISGNAIKIVSDMPSQELRIQNVSACKKNQFLPYALADSDHLDSTLIGDQQSEYGGESVNYQYYPGSVPQWYETVSEIALMQNNAQISEYLKLEQSYREFVYENYLQLTNSAVGVLDRIFVSDMTKEKGLGEILTLVRDTLENKIEYDEGVLTFNGDNDFLKYTLEQSKKGYSVHYATAATLMLRYLGVPSRYVEGYYISSEEASVYAPMEKIEITEAHAHAWTEYYLDGIGWIPLEVTPGYIDEEELRATEQIIADGMGAGKGNSYSQSKLTYKPPKQQEEEKITDWNSLFRFRIKHFIGLFIIILFMMLFSALYLVFKRRARLLEFEERVKQMDDREAIVELFAYGEMLKENCGATSSFEMHVIEKIYKEALFSNHSMRKEYRELMVQYIRELAETCKVNGSVWNQFRDHYILWLY